MPFIQSNQVSQSNRVSADARARTAAGDTAPAIRVRIGMMALGCVLGLYTLWQLAAVFAHPVAPYFLSAAAGEQRDLAPAAARAAAIAQLRGDFWFDAALLAWQETAHGSGADDVRAALVRAARLAPHDARTWLLLALVDAERRTDPTQQAEALKMSYYTGPNDAALIPSRLRLAVQSAAIADPDFQGLVAGEVLTAIRHPALRGAIVAAYRQASPDGKRFLQSAVGMFDSELAGQMRAIESDPLRF